MVTVRRLYLYLMSSVALGILLGGLAGLVRVTIDALGGSQAVLVAGGDRTREDLSLSVALVVVGLPLWMVHAWYAERLAHRGDDAGEAERHSALRALYLAGAGAVTLFLGLTSLMAALRGVGMALLQLGSDPFGADLPGAVSSTVVYLPAWGVLSWMRLRDLRAGPIEWSAAWLSRLGLYGAEAVTLISLAFAVSGAIDVLLRLIVGRPTVGLANWWQVGLIGVVAQGIGAGSAWSLHRRLAGSLVARADGVGAEERASRVRTADPLVVGIVAGVALLLALAGAVSRLLEVPVAGEGDLVTVAQDVVGTLLAALPFLALVAWERGEGGAEARAFGGDARLLSVVRLQDLSTAAAGTALLGVGSAWSLGIILDLGLGGSRTLAVGEEWRRELTQFLGYALVGLPAWAWAWRTIDRRRTADRLADARSTARRGYLYLVGGVAVIAAAASLAFCLYRVLRLAVGLEVANVASDLSAPIGILVVGSAIAATHAALIRADDRLRGGLHIERAAPPPVAPPPLASPQVAAPVGQGISEELVLTGPAGSDLAEVNARLRASLPPGWTLDVRGRAGGPSD